MTETQRCNRWCIAFGVIIGLTAAWITYGMIDWGIFVSLIIGVIFGIAGYYLLKMLFCSDVSDAVAGSSTQSASNPVAAPTPKPSSAADAGATASAAAPAAAASTAAPAAAASADASADASAAAASASADGGSWTDSVDANSGKAGDGRGATGLKPSVVPAEEETLRDGVGSWKYESGASAYKGGSGDGAAATPGEASADASTSAPAAAAPAQTGEPALEGDYDGDGVVEGADEGEKPTTLTAARDGKADDLKQIKGVGPKMEGLLNSLGFYHFDQVAGWSDQEVAWVDANLEGFKGRVSRDNWVAQAKILAEGGVTEFSKKVEDGGVY